jgi:predicted GNAT family acetyltransferase
LFFRVIKIYFCYLCKTLTKLANRYLMGNMIINDNLFLRQYEVEIEDDLAIIEYALQDRKIFLTKLIIPSSNKDEDFEEKFIREVFEIIKEKNIRIMPTSPQVRKFIKKNKEFKEMLPIGVRL